MTTSRLAVAVVFVWSMIAVTLRADVLTELQQAKGSFDHQMAYLESTNAYKLDYLSNKYVKALLAQKKKDLLAEADGLVIITDDELVRVKDGGSLEDIVVTKLHPDLAHIEIEYLKQKHAIDLDYAKKVLRASAAYEKRLKALRIKLTKADDMDGATRVSEEIASIAEIPDVVAATETVEALTETQPPADSGTAHPGWALGIPVSSDCKVQTQTLSAPTPAKFRYSRLPVIATGAAKAGAPPLNIVVFKGAAPDPSPPYYGHSDHAYWSVGKGDMTVDKNFVRVAVGTKDKGTALDQVVVVSQIFVKPDTGSMDNDVLEISRYAVLLTGVDSTGACIDLPPARTALYRNTRKAHYGAVKTFASGQAFYGAIVTVFYNDTLVWQGSSNGTLKPLAIPDSASIPHKPAVYDNTYPDLYALNYVPMW